MSTTTEQTQVQREQLPTGSRQLETCHECGRAYTHSAFLDHLFVSKDCMRRYWKEEEKMHIYRLRHRIKPPTPDVATEC